MFVPTLQVTKITIRLLSNYNLDDSILSIPDVDREIPTPEAFLEAHLDNKNYSSDTKDCITEFFFRILKCKKYLDMIIKKFIKATSPWATATQNEIVINMVFLYLIVVELNEMTRKNIEEILMGISNQKAISLLTFLSSKDMLSKLYEWGCEIWDVEYVKNLLKNSINEQLFEKVCDTLSGRVQQIKKDKIKSLTIPISPKFSERRRPNVVKLDEDKKDRNFSTSFFMRQKSKIPIFKKTKKIPQTTYSHPVAILNKIKQKHIKNREEAINLYEEAQFKAFRCSNPEKSEKFKESTKRIEEERNKVLNTKIKYKKIPLNKNVASPRKTVTVILREGARLLKIESDTIKRYEDIARGGLNSDAILELEEEIREENYCKHIEDIERKHLEGLISYEEAIIARKKFLKKKREEAVKLKKEKDLWGRQLEEWKSKEMLRLQEVVEKEKESEKATKEAVEHVREVKLKIAMEVAEESRALKERRLKEKEEDLHKKFQMIRNIKALQALRAIGRKETDFTETANLGLLCEMSIAELKERLFILKIELNEELEQKKAEIKERRECRKEIVQTYQELIENHRQVTKGQKVVPKRETRDFEYEKRKEICLGSNSLDDLRKKLCNKRKERLIQEM